MTEIEKARSILYNVPDEMFDFWLIPIIEENEFPFTNINDEIGNTIWFGFFGYLPLETFANLKWHRKRNLVPGNIPFKKSSIEIINCIITYNLTDKWTLGNRPMFNCKERFSYHVAFMQRTGRFFAPIILRPTVDGLMVLDGSYRLAALFSMERDDILIDAWIGTLPNK
jgi:hypothetical protein